MKRVRLIQLLLMGAGIPGAAGCKTYEITQFDNVAIASFNPGTYHRAAIITHHLHSGGQPGSTNDKNRLFLEAFQVELMKKGMEVVEREKFEKLVAEQLLIKGEMADLSDREKALRVGKILNVDVVFYGDAVINESRYVYKRGGLQSKSDAARLEEQANTNGVVEGVGVSTIHAYHNAGVTVRAVDARTGEIIWVGYRMLAVCDKVTRKSPTALTNFATIKKLCAMVIDDFRAPRRVAGQAKG